MLCQTVKSEQLPCYRREDKHMMPAGKVTVQVILVLFVCSCLSWTAYGQKECENIQLSKCARKPCTDPTKECPGARCVRCGCKAMCVASAAAEQYPLVQCPDGSAALQCKVPQNKIGCSNIRCAGVPCKEYLCGGRCTAMCVGGGDTSSSASSSSGVSSSTGHNLAATARPLPSTTKPQQPVKTAPAVVNGAATKGTTAQAKVTCDDGSAAVPCKIPDGRVSCATIRCARAPCEEYMCGGKCRPVCMEGNITLSSSSGSSSSSAGHNLAATAVPLIPSTGNAQLTTTIFAGASNPQKHSAVCPDGSAAAQCSVAKGQIGCANVKCAGVPCKEYMCAGRCTPMCMTDLKTSSAAPAGIRPKQQPAANAVKRTTSSTSSSSSASRGLLSLPDKHRNDTTSDEFTCVIGEPVDCLRDPCDDKKCPSGFTCKAEYCGGCNAACVPTNPPCTNGNDRRPCMDTASRCLVAKVCCGITCVPDQCNDCAATAVGPCPPGQFVNRKRLRCVDCPRGSSCAGGDNATITAEPQPCNSGFYADVPGLVECKKCAPGSTTPALPKRKGYFECQPEA